MTPFVCEYNNWWQLKWDCLGEEADPLEAQEAESGVKERGAEPVVNQSGSGKWDSPERRRRRAEEDIREHRAESRKKRREEGQPAEIRADTTATGPRAKGAAAAAADGGDYEGRHRRPEHGSSWEGPRL